MSKVMPSPGATIGQPLSRVRARDGLYLGMSILLLLIVLVGFAPTFFMRILFDPPPISPYVHMHGALMTAWFVLFVVQTSLAYGGRVRSHRELGVVTATIGFVAMLTATVATWDNLVNPVISNVRFLTTIVFGNLGVIVAFTALLTLAVLYRRRPEIHKRLMLFASISFVSPAVGRIAGWPIAMGADLAVFNNSAIVLLILCVVTYELLGRRRVHWLTLALGVSLMTIRVLFNMVIASSSAAQEFVQTFI